MPSAPKKMQQIDSQLSQAICDTVFFLPQIWLMSSFPPKKKSPHILVQKQCHRPHEGWVVNTSKIAFRNQIFALPLLVVPTALKITLLRKVRKNSLFKHLNFLAIGGRIFHHLWRKSLNPKRRWLPPGLFSIFCPWWSSLDITPNPSIDGNIQAIQGKDAFK